MDDLIDGTWVEVYWNFHKKLFSVRVKGKVVGHARRIWLHEVRFKVSEAGRQRVLREKRKNVHAVVRGRWIATPRWAQVETMTVHECPVSYNPYRGPNFTDGQGNPKHWGSYVRLAADSPMMIEDRVRRFLRK